MLSGYSGMTVRMSLEWVSGCSGMRNKTEVIHRRGPWRNLEAVEFATLEWVDWFNNRRLLEPIGNMPPTEAEAHYFAMIDGEDRAA
jgi:transposase InsO family protein